MGLTSPVIPPYIQGPESRFFPVHSSGSFFDVSRLLLLGKGYVVRHTGPIPLDEYFIWSMVTGNPYKILTMGYIQSLPDNLLGVGGRSFGLSFYRALTGIVLYTFIDRKDKEIKALRAWLVESDRLRDFEQMIFQVMRDWYGPSGPSRVYDIREHYGDVATKDKKEKLIREVG